MNIGKKDRWHSKYVCDKCGQQIYYVAQKGIPVHKYYSQDRPSNPIKKDIDLCYECERKFREWLFTKEIPTPKDLIDKFPKWEE